MSFTTRTSPGISEADAKELDNRLGNKFPVSSLPGEHGLGTLLYQQSTPKNSQWPRHRLCVPMPVVN